MMATFEELTASQQWIIQECFEAGGSAINISPKSENNVYDQLCDLGLLRPVMVKSGFKPEYGYRLTTVGYKLVFAHKSNRQNKNEF